MEEMVEAMTFSLSLSLSLELEDDSLEKTMGTLTPKGVFIWFPTRLKWLEFTNGFGHLIYPKIGPNWLVNLTGPTN